MQAIVEDAETARGGVGWTEPRVEVLKTLWLNGLSASEVARRMGGGLTRNAVIGKVWRLKLGGRTASASPAAPRVRPSARAAAPPRPKVRLASPAPAQAPKRLRCTPVVEPAAGTAFAPALEEAGLVTDLLALGAHCCKWPIGDPLSASFSFCGRKADGVYCAPHARRAYAPCRPGTPG